MKSTLTKTGKTSVASEPINITPQKFVSFLREWFGGYPNPDDPRPPGPWDPIIRRAISRMDVFGPLPDPWRQRTSRYHFWGVWLKRVLGQPLSVDDFRPPPLEDAISLAALNPQPLPPHELFAAALAGEVISRAEFMQEIADMIRTGDKETGIIIVGGSVSSFVDWVCGNDLRIDWPFPVPRPSWWKDALTGTGLIVMGIQFENAVGGVFSDDLRGVFKEAGEKLIGAGLSAIQ